jgi:hypothetical protein
MEVHRGVIQDKQGIYAGLLKSQSLNHQLAVCYNDGGKLIVKICTVVHIVGSQEEGSVVLRSQPDDANSETVVPLENIQSIYPIRDFMK